MRESIGSIWSRRRNLLLALTGAVSAVSCMAPSCRMGESPMSFSSDGRQLALTTVEPLRTDKTEFLAGEQTFRVMVVSDQKQVRVLEERSDALLTGPGYSPDGQRIAYLRIPLLTEQQSKQQSEELSARLKLVEDAVDKSWAEWWSHGGRPGASQTQPTQPAASQAVGGTATQSAEAATSQPVIPITDAALPPVTATFSTMADTLFLPTVRADLVVRDVRSGQVLSDTAIELPSPSHNDIYKHTLPQFGPAGQWVYFATGPIVMAVNPASGEKRIMGANSQAAKVSPDGRTLATYMQDDQSGQGIVGLIGTNGQMALYRRVPIAAADVVSWLDNDTLALVTGQKAPAAASQSAEPAVVQPAASQPEVLVIQRLRRDGTLLPPVQITLPRNAHVADDAASGLALAPDGRHVAVGDAKNVLFLTMDGQVLGQWQSDQDVILSEPVFSPDSRQVAFKVSGEIGEKTLRTEEVLFFSNDGKVLGRAEIPAVKPGTTQPAGSQPIKSR